MITCALEGIDTEWLKRNAIPSAVTDALVKAGEEYIAKQLPLRFRVGAAARFGFPIRKRGYMIYKAKKKGHQQDLVFSGNLRRIATSGATVKGRRRAVKATVSIPVPAYATIRKKNMDGVTLKQQLQKLVSEDYRLIAKTAGEEAQRLLRESPKYRYKRLPRKKIV